MPVTPKPRSYVMESEEEAFRLDLKTDPETIRRQARWAGLRPGMRVADLGCGSGKTTGVLAEIVRPGGAAVGVEISEQRLELNRLSARCIYLAREHYLIDSLFVDSLEGKT